MPRLFRLSLKRNEHLEIVMALSGCACCGTRRAGQLGREPLKITLEARGPNSREDWKRGEDGNWQLERGMGKGKG